MESLEIETPIAIAPSTSGNYGNPVITSAANVVKATLGSGLLTLSWSFAHSTMWPGVFCAVLAGILSAQSYAVLGILAERMGQKSFNAIWSCIFGKGQAWVCDFLILLYCTSACIACLIVVGDFLPQGLKGLGNQSEFLQNRRGAITCVFTGVLPLCFLKDLFFLGYTSLLGSMGSMYTGVMLFYETWHVEPSPRESSRFQPGLFVMLPVVSFCYECHFNAPKVDFELERRSTQRWYLVTTIAFSVSILVTIVCGYSGYYMFGTNLLQPDRSNVLVAPALEKKTEAVVAYLATSISISTSVPLYIQSIRESVIIVWLNYTPLAIRERGEKLSDLSRHLIATVLSLMFVFTMSMILQDLGAFLSIVGSLGVATLTYILPSMMYLKSDESVGLLNFLLRRLPLYVSILFGALVGICGLVTTLLLELGVQITPSH